MGKVTDITMSVINFIGKIEKPKHIRLQKHLQRCRFKITAYKN